MKHLNKGGYGALSDRSHYAKLLLPGHMSLRFRRAQSLWARLFASKTTRTTEYDAFEPSRLETDASPENSK